MTVTSPDSKEGIKKSRRRYNNERILPTVLYSVGIRGSGALAALFLNVLFARLLSVANYGRYMTILSFALVLSGISVGGVNYVLTREIAGKIGRLRNSTKTLLQWAVIRVTRGAVAGIVIFSIWAFVVYFREMIISATQVGNALAAGIVLVVLSAFVSIQASVLNGYSAPLKCQSLTLVVKNASIIALLGLLTISFKASINISLALWLQTTGYFVSLLIGGYWIFQKVRDTDSSTRFIVDAQVLENNKKRWATSSRHFFLVTIAVVLVNRLDVVLVSLLADRNVVGLYAAAARLAQAALLIALSMIVVLSPKIAEAYQAGKSSSVSSLIRKGYQFTIPIATLEILGAWYFGPRIISVFGISYSSAARPFFWMVVAYALWTAATPGYAFLSMANREKSLAIINWVILTLNVIFISLLTPLYGASGAGAATCIGYAGAAILVFTMQGRAKSNSRF